MCEVSVVHGGGNGEHKVKQSSSFVLTLLFLNHRINVGLDPYRKGSMTGN